MTRLLPVAETSSTYRPKLGHTEKRMGATKSIVSLAFSEFNGSSIRLS